MANGKKWEKMLLEVKELVGKSNELLFDRATRLVAVYHDKDFQDYHKGDADKIESHLDQYVADYGVTFYDVLEMLKWFPSRGEWSKGSVRQILAESLERRDATRPAKEATAIKRSNPIPVKEHEAVKKELAQEVARAKSLASEIQELRDENRRLTRELAMAEGRISELERMVKRDLATA